MRVIPPTRTTASMSLALSSASLRAFSQGCGRLINQVADQAFQLGAGQFVLKVLRAFGVSRQERQVNVDFLGGRQFNLGFFGFVAQALHGGFVIGNVDAVFFFELVGKVVDDHAVKVGAAEVGVAVGALTSNTPSPSSRMDTSKVPPPRS